MAFRARVELFLVSGTFSVLSAGDSTALKGVAPLLPGRRDWEGREVVGVSAGVPSAEGGSGAIEGEPPGSWPLSCCTPAGSAASPGMDPGWISVGGVGLDSAGIAGGTRVGTPGGGGAWGAQVETGDSTNARPGGDGRG